MRGGLRVVIILDVLPGVARRCRVIQIGRGRVKVLSRSEVKRLAKNAAPHARRMILLVANTGVRSEELAMLAWRGVDVKRRQLALPCERLFGRRQIRIGSAATAVLREARSDGGYRVFPPGEASTARLEAELRNACDAAGLPRLSFTDLQNTWAYWWIRCGQSWRELAVVLDVSDDEVLRRFRVLVADFQPRPRHGFKLGEWPPPPDNVLPFPIRIPSQTVESERH